VTPGNDRTASAPTSEPADTDRLKEDLRREHEMYLRALADFDNYRRRVERERASMAQSGKRDLVLSLLELADSFDRAFRQMGEAPSATLEGVQAIHRKLMSLLEAEGVVPFKSEGEAFDPALHEAVGSVQNGGYGPGVIADEVQRGYRWGQELLRPARVRVVQ
jgi:molecular chaperone GrpE